MGPIRLPPVPYAMLKAIVRGTREDPVGGTQLLQASQPLELRRVDDAGAEGIQLDVPMHRIIEYLAAVGQVE